MTAAEPPGHGTNLMPLETSIDRLAELYKEGLTGKLNRPFILFGHSMGGLVVYRLTQLLERKASIRQQLSFLPFSRRKQKDKY